MNDIEIGYRLGRLDSTFNLGVNQVFGSNIWYSQFKPVKGVVGYTIYFKHDDKNHRADLEYSIDEDIPTKVKIVEDLKLARQEAIDWMNNVQAQ